MASFFENGGYSRSVVTNTHRRTQGISRERALGNSERGDSARRSDKVPLVLTFVDQSEPRKGPLLSSHSFSRGFWRLTFGCAFKRFVNVYLTKQRGVHPLTFREKEPKVKALMFK